MKHFFRKSIWLGVLLLLSGAGCTSSLWEGTTAKEAIVRDVESMMPLAASWLVQNIRDNGLFYYIYIPRSSTYPNKNNALRQLMGSRLLGELAKEDSALVPFHQKNLDYIFVNWYRETPEGLGYVLFDSKSKLGANAMLLRTIAVSPLYESYKQEGDAVARGIMSLMQDDGAFLPWFVAPEYTYDSERLLHFYSGEAVLALLEYYDRTGDQVYLDAAIRAEEYYYVRYIDNIDTYYYPAYVPWHTLALSHLYEKTGEVRYAEGIFILNDRLLELLDRSEYVGRFYTSSTPQYGSPHSASDGVYTEGLVYAYEVAKKVGDTQRAETYLDALRLAVHHLSSLQYTHEDVGRDLEPWRREGAFRVSVTNSSIRIDTTQHALDAFRKINSVLGGEVDLGE